jgi:ParB family chromosome partitioning protein
MNNQNKGYRGLGRGLETLLNAPRASASHLSADTKIIAPVNTLSTSSLRSGRFQPRKSFDEESINTLAESIKAQGIVQPIVVRELSQGSYEIVAGERRWRAAQKAGLENVPIIIRNDIDDRQSMAIALIENIQREDLNVIEEAEGLSRLNREFRLTHEEISRIVGRSRSSITNSLRLLELNIDVQTMVREDKLKMGHARALLSLNVAEQKLAAEQIYQKNMTTREVEQLVGSLVKGDKNSNVSKAVAVSAKQKKLATALQRQLAEVLKKPVKINYKADGQSSVNIRFTNIEEIKELVSKLTDK